MAATFEDIYNLVKAAYHGEDVYDPLHDALTELGMYGLISLHLNKDCMDAKNCFRIQSKRVKGCFITCAVLVGVNITFKGYKFVPNIELETLLKYTQPYRDMDGNKYKYSEKTAEVILK